MTGDIAGHAVFFRLSLICQLVWSAHLKTGTYMIHEAMGSRAEAIRSKDGGGGFPR